MSGQHALFFTSDAKRRIAELERPEPTELIYSLDALAVALGISKAVVLGRVKRGTIPAPDRIIAGEPRWLAATVEPLLASFGRPTVGERLRGDSREASGHGVTMKWHVSKTQRRGDPEQG